jgi:hypothetical protein
MLRSIGLSGSANASDALAQAGRGAGVSAVELGGQRRTVFAPSPTASATAGEERNGACPAWGGVVAGAGFASQISPTPAIGAVRPRSPVLESGQDYVEGRQPHSN